MNQTAAPLATASELQQDVSYCLFVGTGQQNKACILWEPEAVLHGRMAGRVGRVGRGDNDYKNA